MTIGKLEPFNVESDNWSTYVERLEQYFIVNETKEEHKGPMLITVMGNQAYELLVTLCTPDKPASKKFSELVKVMSGHLQPKPSVLAERYRFRNRKQRTGESVADFIAELKKLAKHCAFEAGLKENLRDQLVCGLREEAIRQRLFTEENIAFDRALLVAVAMEAAQANAAAVEGRKGDFEPVAGTSSGCHAVSAQTWRGKSAMTSYQPGNNSAPRLVNHGTARPPAPAPRRAGPAAREPRRQNHPSSDTECRVCGRLHDSTRCKFAKYVCRVCNQPGHLKRMCPRLLTGTGTHNNEVQEETDSDFSDEVPFNVFNVNNIHQFKPFMLSVGLEGKSVYMEVDTGSAISCIGLDLYLKLFPNVPLLNSNLIMCYYTGEKKQPMGKIRLNVTFKNICKNLELYVVDKGKTPLLGRQWLHELGIEWKELSCHKVKVTSPFDLNEINSRYSEVFSEGLGRYNGGEVSLRVREDARPVFLRARPLAYALREPVERALDQLVRDGVIAPVETSDWATPIVPVVKADGTIRRSKLPFNSVTVLIFVLQLIANVCCTQFASHVSVNTPARSFTHGVGDPLPTRRGYQGLRRSKRPPVRETQRRHPQRTTQRSGGIGYPRVRPVIPFNSEEIRGAGLNALTWPYDSQMETAIPVLPPSPYRVDSPDPESLWPEGLFLPPLSSHFGNFGRRTDSEPEIIDPYLLEGSEAIAAVKKAREHGVYYFHDIPHIESLLANQQLRLENDLEPHRIASIRHTWPYNRP